jgi:hypothetical protein
MGKAPSEHFWEKNKHRYPHQCEVVHFSPQDPDPRTVQQEVTFHFLRVPFDGKAHWGFLEERHLNQFLALVAEK